MKDLFYTTIVLTFLLIAVQTKAQGLNPKSFEIKHGEFLLNDNPFKIYSGEMHYSRIPKEYWRHRFKMIKALGLNTVATYAFWNYHETAPGVWDFETGNRNLAEYIQTAQEEGLYVILRPGPYVCAEWEFGGYPWWLQKNPDLVVRAYNKPFLDSCKTYFSKLADQLVDLQVSHGGPIILVQIENEFGSYISQRTDISLTEHKKYYDAIYKMLREVGFDGPFFTSDATSLFDGGAITGILPTANGEGNIQNLRNSINNYYSGGPYMVAEYYPGWLDHWGEKFIRISPEENRKQVQLYLENEINFNIYMAHGGTNFGFTAGANYSNDSDIQPDLTSYDYDAPISEAGWATPKYYLIRTEFLNHTNYDIPDIPDQIPVIQLPKNIILTGYDFFSWLKNKVPVVNSSPLNFEDLNQGFGYVVYRHHFSNAINGTLQIKGLRDFATIYVNNQRVGELNRIHNQYNLEIEIPANGLLDILVENMGRINYGARIIDNKKGIVSPVYINDQEIKNYWEMYCVPMDIKPRLAEDKGSPSPGMPTLYKAGFDLKNLGDIFLDMSDWGKGIVFVNGKNIGRYWNIGPQQTLYLPGCWLNKGHNEIIVFEQLNDNVPLTIKSSETPILEEMNMGHH